MIFSELIYKLLSSTEYGTRDNTLNSVKSWISKDATLYVSNTELYNECLEKIYEFHEKISSRFSRKTVFELINKKIPKLKATEKQKVELEDFFETLLSVEARNLTVISPISGIRLDGDAKEFLIPPYKFGYLNNLGFPIASESGLYISVEIKSVYDKNIAISKAENAFLDFARLIVFMSGKLDHSILITTGLPLMPSYNHESMYVKTSSYQVTDEQGVLDFSSISNKIIKKIPVNDDFFCKNEAFNKLWEFNNRRINGPKLHDIDSRIINSAIALGESALTADRKNSVLYTCMSLEIMFSHDERELFQRSIGDKLSDLFTFIVAKDKDSRLQTSKVVKNVYAMRSAIVHGGNKELTNENLAINFLMRAAISEILNNEKFSHLKNIGDLNRMLKEAQNSY